MSTTKYDIPKVDGFTEEQVMEELKAQGTLEQYALAEEPAEPEPETAEQAEPETAPAPPEEGVTEEAEPEGDKLPRTIPYERFQEHVRKTREKEAEYARQIDEYRRQQAELLKVQQEVMRKQMEAATPKPEPVEEDPLDVLIRSKVEAQVKPLRERIESQQRAEALQKRVVESEAQVKARFRDYDTVAGPVIERMKLATQAAQNGDADAAQWLKGIVMDDNPALKAYTLGLWEKANAQGTPPHAPTVSPAPRQGNTPPALPRGTQIGGSSSPDAAVDARRVANMPLNEFAEWAKKNPVLHKKYLRGEI